MLALCLAYLDEDNDKSLFEEIYLAYRKQMVALAMSMLKNSEDAQDVVADVFLKIAQRRWDVIRGIENRTDLRNYLLKATKRTALNKLKSSKRTYISDDFINAYETDKQSDCSEEEFFHSVCHHLEYQEVVKAMASLGEKYRDVLYYHYVLEMSAPQIAKELDQTLSATKKQLVRGKKLLLNLLGTKEGVKNGDQ